MKNPIKESPNRAPHMSVATRCACCRWALICSLRRATGGMTLLLLIDDDDDAILIVDEVVLAVLVVVATAAADVVTRSIVVKGTTTREEASFEFCNREGMWNQDTETFKGDVEMTYVRRMYERSNSRASWSHRENLVAVAAEPTDAFGKSAAAAVTRLLMTSIYP